MTNNAALRTYVNKTENRIPINLKRRYYLELLTPKMMKLLRSTYNKVTKIENDKNVSHLELTEIALVHCIL